MEEVILVDENDNAIRLMEKIKAHQNGGKLHRALSVLIFNSKNELMIQQRAFEKYHWPRIWANTCCTHPRQGEKTIDAAHRRLMEEMGFDTEIEEKFVFTYKADFENGLTEHETDHVFFGNYEPNPKINPEEVNAFKWISIPNLLNDIQQNPNNYAPWFKIILEKTQEKGLL